MKTSLKAFACLLLSTTMASFCVYAADAAPVKNIVLVHGSFADGSGWSGVANILLKDGYTVSVVQEPETSFADDVAATTRIIDLQTGPVILVGHSYGGSVVTQAGNDSKVAGLVFIAAFQPAAGEATGQLAQKIPAATTAIKPTADGFLYLDPDQFPKDFAGDLPEAEARLMAKSQVMTAAAAFGTPITQAAWASKPSWAVVATEDRAINPELERFMTKRAQSITTEIKASHSVYISHPEEVARVIEQSATNSAR